jgi:diguanylate cyclase (GGDEF)-like protein
MDMAPEAETLESAYTAQLRARAREWHPASAPLDDTNCPALLRSALLALVDATPGIVMVSNSRGRLLYMNGMGRRMLGIARDAVVVSRTVYDVYSPQSCELLLGEAVPTCLSTGIWRGEITLIDSTGAEIPVSQVLMAHRVREQDGKETTVLSSIAWDIREMKQVEHQLRHQATHDALTGLPNRAMLMDSLTQAIHSAEWNQHCVGVLFLDLDGFKQINDTLGHETANQLLRGLGQRLKSRVRGHDVVARYGGDEFVLLIPDLAEPGDISRVIQQVQEVMWEPFVIGGESVWIKASTGLAIYPQDGTDADTLLQKADSNMYRQKKELKVAS